MDRAKEIIESLIRPKPLSPEKQEYQNLVYQTIRKLLIDLHQGGFCQEPSENERHYWVALKGKSQQQYAVLAYAEFKNGLLKQADVDAGDWNVPVEEKRILLFGLSKLDPSVSFSDPLWEGARLFAMRKSHKGTKNERLSKQEGEVFLNELLNAQIDQEETEKEFEKARRASPNWRHYWAKEGPPLALETKSASKLPS